MEEEVEVVCAQQDILSGSAPRTDKGRMNGEKCGSQKEGRKEGPQFGDGDIPSQKRGVRDCMPAHALF